MKRIEVNLRRSWVIAAVVTLVVVIGLTRAQVPPPATVAPPAFLTTLGLKFDGSPTCSNASCHGAAAATEKPNFWGNEFTLWHDKKDPHHSAYRTLISPKAKQIAAALKIASAIKSERCLNCHSTFAVGPAGQDLKGAQYSPAEGVACSACHGPSEKYSKPHSTQGWIDTERKAGHAALLAKWGIYDTLPVFERATRCTSCHLTIDSDLVVAGHPQPTFEMNHFSMIYPDRHWHDPAGLFPAQLWASGQLAELHDAMLQVAMHAASKAPTAADDVKKADDQAMAHVAVFNSLASLASIDVTELNAAVKALSDAVATKDMAKIGTSATATAKACETKPLVQAVAGFKPDAPTALKLLSAIAMAETGKTYGPRGEEQQAYAIEALATAAGNTAILTAVKPMLPAKPGEPPKAEDYAKALAALQGQLPK